MRALLPPSLILPLIVSLALAACSGGAGDAGAKDGGKGGRMNKPQQVRVAPVSPHVFIDALEAVGTARAADSVIIAANVTERIRKLHFSDGQFVRKGQLLVELTSSREQADFAGARARLAEAQAKVARLKPLLSQGYTTGALYDEAVAERDSARAQMDSISAEIADRTIRAPSSGVVGMRDVSAGGMAGTDKPILELTDLSIIEVDFTVPETALASVTQGQALRARAAAYPDRNFDGRIIAIDPQVDSITRAIRVRARIPNASALLKPGMLLDIRIVRAQRTSMAVPEQALVGHGNEVSVFVLEADGKSVREQRIVAGAREPGIVEVTQGIKSGDMIVTAGVHKIRDGAPVIPTTTQAQQPAEAGATP